MGNELKFDNKLDAERFSSDIRINSLASGNPFHQTLVHSSTTKVFEFLLLYIRVQKSRRGLISSKSAGRFSSHSEVNNIIYKSTTIHNFDTC